MSGSFESTFTSRRTLASAIIFPVAVNLSMPIGLPMQLAIFDKSRLDLRLNFKIWNFTQIGMESGSSFWKLRFAFVPANEEGPAVVLDAEVMMKNKGLLLERVADDCRFAAFWISRQSIQLVSLNATTDALQNGILIFCSLKESSIATPQKLRGQGRSKEEDLGGKRGVNTNYLNYK
ncbi:hypothetical protein MRB53_016857 [Persea americana]|uniref:Uncharacterized protein n=1 Tax=Persea americana TaxID=3435 RepID=A0ACC2M3C1_PERAE|nr:hypothetical protein MRB53_016857 [Persea americana]